MPCTLHCPPFAPSPHFAFQLSAKLDRNARIVCDSIIESGALVPLCNMLRSSLVVTHKYALELLCYLVSYSDGACCPVNALLHIPPAHHSLTDMKRQAYQAGILPPLIQLLTTRERVVLQNSIAMIRNMSLLPDHRSATFQNLSLLQLIRVDLVEAMFVCSPVPQFFILFLI